MTFEKICSGIPSMDKILDYIRLGDNVVFQVSCLDDFRKLANAFLKQALADRKKINYIRFAHHDPILEPQEGLNIYDLNAATGFEHFTIQVHEIIEKEGPGVFYVFDCLSDLQVAWFTDLMMGNFFCVTCPYLSELDTVAYFPILRGHHDYATIARIQETTQILVDIHSNQETMYLHPIKVWNRYSPEMYFPHKLNEDGEFTGLTNSVDLADYFNLIHSEQRNESEQNLDSYERFFNEAIKSYYQGNLSDWTLSKITRSMMTHDRKMAELIKKEFSPEDFFFIKKRMIGTGTIGGKACGMLLARKILENYLPESKKYMEPHDSFYIGTDVFYSYIVENKLWKLRILGRKEEHYFDAGRELAEAILKGQFPPAIRAQFRRMLDYFGQVPIIVRSSSFLEDGFDSAFAGKYESVFCPNGFSPEERLEMFENAVRQVYASTLSPAALEYRRKRGLSAADEQMALLVQRVSGTKFGDYYMPCVAGVGFSYSVYRWNDDASEGGFLRLVAGLGTRAVERTGTDYPRLVSLDKPESTPLVSEEEKHHFSQRYFDLINTKTNEFAEVPASTLLPRLPEWYVHLVCEHDTAAERMFRDRGQYRSVRFVSCRGVAKHKELMRILQKILTTLETYYKVPVDIEFTINFNPDFSFVINLLQCRPLAVWQQGISQNVPEIGKEDLLFRVHKTFMGNSSSLNVDVVVYIDAQQYNILPYQQKSSIRNLVGKINQYYKESGKNLMLISPGRIGTSSPELGLTVSFADISNFKILCEYEDRRIGFAPELSYGSHMFQDLVEAEMFYVALMDKEENLWQRDFWQEKESILSRIVPVTDNLSKVIKVYECNGDRALKLFADYKNRQVVCGNVRS